jgi:hypothetical protein
MSIEPPNSRVPIDFISAGRRNESYFTKVRGLDVTEFYDKNRGGFIVERLRDEWKNNYDFVLVDSRTGITDIGGICTVQLPDMLVLLFTATDQSLRGVIEVERKAQAARQKLPFDRLSLVSLPIPSRFDAQQEFKVSQEWLDRFAEDLAPIYANWLPISAASREALPKNGISNRSDFLDKAELPNRRKFLEITKIPYSPYFSFGEKLPVVEHGTTDPTSLGYAYETLAALIGNNLNSVDLLVAQRQEFVATARSAANGPMAVIETAAVDSSVSRGHRKSDILSLVADSVAQSYVSSDVTKLLLLLYAQVEQVSESGDVDNVTRMAADFMALARAIASNPPRLKWIELSLDEIKESALRSGEPGKPILKTIDALDALLLHSHEAG